MFKNLGRKNLGIWSNLNRLDSDVKQQAIEVLNSSEDESIDEESFQFSINQKISEYEKMVEFVMVKYQASLELLEKANLQNDILRYKSKRQEKVIKKLEQENWYLNQQLGERSEVNDAGQKSDDQIDSSSKIKFDSESNVKDKDKKYESPLYSSKPFDRIEQKQKE